MASFFCLSIRFLEPTYHGRRDGGEPEWPPSPLRVFQALIPAAVARWSAAEFNDIAVPALTWLERLEPPEIVSPAAVPGPSSYRLYVPNNAADEVAAAWVREAKPGADRRSPLAVCSPVVGAEKLARRMADYRIEKDVQPTRIHASEAAPTVHYLWKLPDPVSAQVECWMNALSAAARGITHVGWGIDQVAGYGRRLSAVESESLDRTGFRWRASPSGGTPLRTPKDGSLADMRTRHEKFMSRLSDDGRTFATVPSLTVFTSTRYHAATLPSQIASDPRPFAAFELRTPDFERFQSFDPVRRTATVAGMVRHALADLARLTRPFGWTDADINTFVYGHSPDGTQPARGERADQRFAFLPLPSLEQRRGRGSVATATRRILVVGPPGRDDAVAWARALSGQVLTPLDERTQPAALRLFDRPSASLRADPNLGPYVGESTTWSTVTPVLRPGHDDGDVGKAEHLLRITFLQAGLPAELVRTAQLEWRASGFRAGVDLAWRYELPPLKLPAYHVRVRWRVPVRGPFAVGAGRYRGLGIFAIDNES